MNRIHRWANRLGLLFALGTAAAPGPTATVIIEGTAAVEDATLYSNDTDGNSGGHTGFFAGRTGVGSNLRGVIRFDTSGIDPSFMVTEATLELTVEMATGTADTHSLHRVTASWVEGTGAGVGTGGGAGGTVVNGAVTWASREHPSVAWGTPGGDFEPVASASAAGLDVGETAVWSDSTTGDGMVADVQGWVSDPSSNFGWLIKGEETTNATARRYTSSEGTGSPPRLILTVIDPSAPSAVGSAHLYR